MMGMPLSAYCRYFRLTYPQHALGRFAAVCEAAQMRVSTFAAEAHGSLLKNIGLLPLSWKVAAPNEVFLGFI